MGSQMLELLKVFLIVLGILAALWGIYDLQGDGQQSSVGIKKLIGGIAFAIICGFTMTWAINSVKSAESKAGITAAAYYLPMIIHSITGFRM